MHIRLGFNLIRNTYDSFKRTFFFYISSNIEIITSLIVFLVNIELSPKPFIEFNNFYLLKIFKHLHKYKYDY